jgi:hypothetical protein
VEVRPFFALEGPRWDSWTSGQIAPVSQSNSQSSECVGADVGTVSVGTKAVGTRWSASHVLIWTMLTMGALALVARLGGAFRRGPRRRPAGERVRGIPATARPGCWPSHAPCRAPCSEPCGRRPIGAWGDASVPSDIQAQRDRIGSPDDLPVPRGRSSRRRRTVRRRWCRWHRQRGRGLLRRLRRRCRCVRAECGSWPPR